MTRAVALLLCWLVIQPAWAEGPGAMQQVPGASIASAAEDFVRQNLPADPQDAVRCTATLPPQRVPAGTVLLVAHWNGPPVGGSGRVIVPVRILVDNRLAGEVAVLVSVSHHAAEPVAAAAVRKGDAITVAVETAGGGLHLDVPAVALQPGAVGEEIHVEVADTHRTLTVRIVAPHQATLQP